MQIGGRCLVLVVLGLLSLVGCAESAASPREPVMPTASSSTAAPAIYVVGGQVTGLRGIGLTLRDARGEELKVRSDGMFVFGTPLADKAKFAVTIDREPISPVQTCFVDHGAGKITGHDALEINVICSTVSFENALSPLPEIDAATATKADARHASR